ncbi:cysteine-rich CWC family protein [Oceanicoccus sp. KOV_DT_Chl]|uniref:cysteine-rich CWC family protein n=1 Tax=Oceanicoccus sp. KOV_DT_Chl TaxID=1904639 RepID=UPI000C7B74CD
MRTTDTTSCPLCAKPNLCAVASNPQAQDCWCQQTVIPKALIFKANQSNNSKRCICKTCATAAQKLSKEIK